tara:strand:+ start:1354 stop:1734 length:381 start_codon:yes stop_codon:yes gene_type:complete
MRSAPERFTKVIELPVHTIGLVLELRGSDIPPDVHGIFMKMPTAGKANQRDIHEYAGNAAPSVGTEAVVATGGKGIRFLQNKKTPKTPVLLKTQRYAAGEALVKPIPPADGSYRFKSVVTVYGLIP